ncbi:MAG: protein-export chaperone SecB [Proteobacteria bacterium]|nr:protein-export chaperone SecB [Pseudomonadota bacterium]
MAEENNQIEENNQAAATEGQPNPEGIQFTVQKLYAKDVSFEVPNSPTIFTEQGQTDIKLNLGQRVEEMENDLFEVTLTITVTATVGEKTAYLAEVVQAGIFQISGFNEQSHHAAVNTLCPTTLFPYARTMISGLVSDGGFPPLVLQPINFDALYAQRMQQAQAEATANATPEGEA